MKGKAWRRAVTAAFPSGRAGDKAAASGRTIALGQGRMLRFLYEKARAAFTRQAEPGAPPANMMTDAPEEEDFDERLLAVLVCPYSHEALRHDKETGELIADRAGLAYAIVDGIPILLVSEARRVPGNRTSASALIASISASIRA